MNYKQTRQSANLSITQISDFLGVGPRMVRYYEAGDRVPSKSVERLYGQIRGNGDDFRAWLDQMVKEKK